VQVNNAKEILDRGIINGTTTPVNNVPNFNYSRSPTKVGRIEHTIPPDFNADASLWDTQEERALSAARQQEVLSHHATISSFFTWGVRYDPPEGLSQRHRTVQIPVAVGTSLKDVLSRITTGQIYSANIFVTASIAGYNTALVVFVTACGASELDLPSMSMSLAAPARIVPTLTWPINDAMARKISNGWTRCVSIRGFGTQYDLNEILNMLVPPAYGRDNALLAAHRGEDGTIYMQFYSIQAADCVYHAARKICSRSATVSFEYDPCDPTKGTTFNSVDVSPTSSFGSQPDRVTAHSNIEASPIKIHELKYTGAGNSWAEEIEEDEEMALNNAHGVANLSTDLASEIGHATLPTTCDIQHIASSSSANVMTASKSQLQPNHEIQAETESSAATTTQSDSQADTSLDTGLEEAAGGGIEYGVRIDENPVHEVEQAAPLTETFNMNVKSCASENLQSRIILSGLVSRRRYSDAGDDDDTAAAEQKIAQTINPESKRVQISLKDNSNRTSNRLPDGYVYKGIEDSIWEDAPSDDANDKAKEPKFKKSAANRCDSKKLESRKPEPQKVQMLAKTNSEEVPNAESSARKPRAPRELPDDYVYKGINDSRWAGSDDDSKVEPEKAESKKLESKKPVAKNTPTPATINSPEIMNTESGITKPRTRKELPADYVYKGIDDSQWADAPNDIKSEPKKAQPKKVRASGKINEGKGSKTKNISKDLKANILNDAIMAEANGLPTYEVIGKMGPYDVQKIVDNDSVSGKPAGTKTNCLGNSKPADANGFAKKDVKAFEVVQAGKL
jgi:hypothetical protein